MFSFLNASPNADRSSVPDIARSVAAQEVILIDVREMAEVRSSGLAAGAINIPLSLLPLKADPRQPGHELSPGRPVVVYCASGARSASAAQLLSRLGYGPVVNLGGLGDWVAGGGQVVPA